MLDFKKILVIDPEKCNGCRTCEVVCSLRHNGVCDPTRSNIHVITLGMQGNSIPIVCQQCEKALCKEVCPVSAISRDSKTDALVIDEEVCIGCRLCMSICPFGGITIDPIRNVVMKCDLCEGNPVCTRFCAPGALKYVRVDKLSLVMKRSKTEQISRLLRLVMKGPELEAE